MEILDWVANSGEVLAERLLGDNDRASAVIGVEREGGCILETAIEEEDDMMIGIIDESKRTDRTGFKPQIAHHPFGRSKRQFAGSFLALRDENILEPVLNIMDGEIVIARETDEVMLVHFMIAHEDVFAMNRAIVMPPPLGLLNRFSLRVIIRSERDMMVL